MVERPTRVGPRRGIATSSIHDPGSGQGPLPLGTPLSPPLHQTSTFSFDTPEEMIAVFNGERVGFVYSRYGNPTVQDVEDLRTAIRETRNATR